MISNREQPVAWAQLMYNLEDASEHLAKLIAEMNTAQDFSEEDFAIQLGHVMAHLNRAWYCRNHGSALTQEEWDAARAYPDDLDPVA